MELSRSVRAASVVASAMVVACAACGHVASRPEPTSAGPVHRCSGDSSAAGQARLALQNPPRTAAVRVTIGSTIDVRIASGQKTFIVPGTPAHLCQVSIESRHSGHVLIVHYRAVSAGVAHLHTYNVPIGHIENIPLEGTVTITRPER